MNILIACEESQTVCKEFRRKGHTAYSCDIIDCSGGHPEWHIKQDVLPLINGNCTFTTCDGKSHTLTGKWDILIAHPPCTYLCLTGLQYCDELRYGEKARLRKEKQKEAIEFFMQFINADCDRIAVENPVGVMNSLYKKATQTVRPFQFGHPAGKKTCLWLKNLSPLVPTKIVEIEYCYSGTGRRWEKWFYEGSRISDPVEKSKFRSKTFEGIAKAMAEQWG